MAKKEPEWEDEEYEEEETEEEEEEDLIDAYEKSIRSLMKERSKYKSMSEEYAILTQRIGDEQENLRIAEAALNDRTQRDVTDKTRYVGYLQAAGNLLGNLGGQLIGSLFNRKNVTTIVDTEQNGGIVKSAAMKFTK